MLTLVLVKQWIEHAPPAVEWKPGTPTGWAMVDGHVICAGCASRITGRGCDFRGVQPIWDREVTCEAGCFQLANDPPAPRRAPTVVNEPERQRVLIDGLDCLPGQLDLF